MTPTWAHEALKKIESDGLRRFPETIEALDGPVAQIQGRKTLVMCSNNYLGLADDQRVRNAGAAAAVEWGAGAGASRLVSGTTVLHHELEQAIAAWKGCDDAIVFSSGYLANVGVIPVLATEGDIIFSDELNHASIVDGCRLSRAQRSTFRHLDYADLETQLERTNGDRRLIVTDTVFSMDGDLADLPRLVELRDRCGAMLMVDEAHATGLLGERGAGAVSAAGLSGQVDIVMGTLSKAVGASGGFVAGSGTLMDLLRNRARTYIFDTALAPASVGAAIEAIEIIQREPQRIELALNLAQRVHRGLNDFGFKTTPPTAAVIPVFAGSSEQALKWSARLLELGILCPAIRPPSVPIDACRLRVTVTAAHSDAQIEQALAAFEALASDRAETK